MSYTKNRKGFTLIELLIVVVIAGILALSAVPMITTNTREARRSEGETLLGVMRDHARVEYAREGNAPTKLNACGFKAATRKGSYFKAQNKIRNSNVHDAFVRVVPTAGDDGRGELHFDWESGSSTIVWK